MTKLLATADIHGQWLVYDWLAETAREQKADVVVAAGDLLGGGWQEEQREQASEIIAAFKRFGIPVLYIMGNDDFLPLDYEDQEIRPLHGKRIDWGSYSFVGYQYSLPFVGGIFEKSEQEIGQDLLKLEPLVDDRTVLVTHSPAFGSLDLIYDGTHVGSQSLTAFIERRPVLAHIHGHIHGSFGHDANHFNVASGGQRRAVLVELPSLEHKLLVED